MEKDKLIKTFDEEISSGISAIQDVEINTDEYGKAVDNIAVLTEKTIKLKGEVFDHEKGLAMAISKKMFGNCGGYYEVFKKYLPKETAFDLTNYMTPPEEGKDEKNN